MDAAVGNMEWMHLIKIIFLNVFLEFFLKRYKFMYYLNYVLHIWGNSRWVVKSDLYNIKMSVFHDKPWLPLSDKGIF